MESFNANGIKGEFKNIYGLIYFFILEVFGIINCWKFLIKI